MNTISDSIERAKHRGIPGEAPDSQGVTATEAQAIITGARTKHVSETEIYDSFASAGLASLYRNAAHAVTAKPIAMSRFVVPDNADTRCADALSDAARAWQAKRLTPGELSIALAAMDALAVAAGSGRAGWTRPGLDPNERAHQVLSRANDAAYLARRMYYEVFGMQPGARRDQRVIHTLQLLDAAERLSRNPAVQTNHDGINAEPLAALTQELKTLRSGLGNLPQS